MKPDRTPPHNEPVERAVLGAAILEPEEVLGLAIQEHITEAHFYKPENAAIYGALSEMYNSEEKIDQITLCDKLNRMKKMELIGGEIEIAKLIGDTVSSANILAHLDILADKYRARKIITLSNMARDQAYAGYSAAEIIELLETQITEIQETAQKTNIASMRDSIPDAMSQLGEMNQKAGLLTGVDTGYGRLNYATGGFQPGHLIILGGRTGQGKSSLALSMSISAAKAGHDVLFFSLEMTGMELTKRAISQESGFNIPSLNYRKPSEQDWNKLVAGADSAYNYRGQIHIDESGGLSVWEISARAKRFQREHNLGMIVVDYIQIGRGDKKGSREQEIASITNQLKALAKNLKVPILALAQVSRRVEDNGKERRPVLSDLRESGAIENDADMVIFIYNPQLEQFNDDHFEYLLPPDLHPRELREMVVAKHRHGEASRFYTRWNRESARFENMEYEKATNGKKTNISYG